MTISATTQGLRPGVCTSSNRPVTPFEGQIIYETDTDMVAIWNGTAWRYIASTTATSGTVLQVVASTTATQGVSTSSTYGDTGLTATITPKSASSNILVCVSQNGVHKSSGDTSVGLILLRTATTICTFGVELGLNSSATQSNIGSASAMVLDSPATTSAVTYKTQYRSDANIAYAVVQRNGTASTMTLMEVAG